ncbi:MAG: FMN-binding protein [Streptosporangiaceae bacterium]
MKGAPWLVLVGTVAGFLGVVGLHKSAPAVALGGAARQPAGQGVSAPARSPSATPPATGSGAATGPGNVNATTSGAMEQYGYGELTARVTISGGGITTVTVPVLRTAEQYSQQLAAQVIPMLRHEVLTAQSASINAVSGATYTSQAYAQSVQAALDKAHFK